MWLSYLHIDMTLVYNKPLSTTRSRYSQKMSTQYSCTFKVRLFM